jgi:hypothetical protein
LRIRFEIVDIIKSIDIKSIIGSIVILIGLTIFVFILIGKKSSTPRWVSELDKETIALVYSMENRDVMTQGFQGLKTITIGYKIEYAYRVNDIEYKDFQDIKNRTGNLKKISYVRKNMKEWNFIVKYSSSNPKRNYLIIDNE